MVYCTFCGLSNDEKCVRKTRIYPNQEDDSADKQRGPICKLCDRKFLLHKEVEKVRQLISVSKLSLAEGIKRLETQGMDAKN